MRQASRAHKAAARAPQQRILVATDGSASAEAAVRTVLLFPWSGAARARGVVANFPWPRTESPAAQEALRRSVETGAQAAERALRSRWPAARVAVADAPPVDAIIAAARTFKATVIALGWRGHGRFKRMIAGSVSRMVAAHARCGVLIARQAPKAVRRIVVGFDGSPNALGAIELLASLKVPTRGRVILVDAVLPHVLPATAGRLPEATRLELKRHLHDWNAQCRAEARKRLESAAAALRRVGWKVGIEVREAPPVAAILSAAEEHAADVVVVGASAKTVMQRAVLGSVANGVLDRCRVPVLLARARTRRTPAA